MGDFFVKFLNWILYLQKMAFKIKLLARQITPTCRIPGEIKVHRWHSTSISGHPGPKLHVPAGTQSTLGLKLNDSDTKMHEPVIISG